MEVIRIDEIASWLKINKRTIRRMIKSGEFPKSFKISSRNVAWDKKEIDEWLQDRKIIHDTVSNPRGI